MMTEPKLEQALHFRSTAEPLLVNFDYKSPIIKELHFSKPTQALIYQLTNDQDIMGKLWAAWSIKGTT